MQERAGEWGGTYHIEKHSLVGTLVSVWLPDQADRPAQLVQGSPTS